jgi:hypothetical protein
MSVVRAAIDGIGGRALAARSLPFVVAAHALAAPLAAQQLPTGRIEGTIKESARPRGVKGAIVTVARLEPEPAVSFGARPDERGHYQFDSLPVGRYMVQLTHETLDSLDLVLPAA